MYIVNFFKHFKKVCTHKRWVFHYCVKAGIPFQGMMHDLSKFSPVEFFESVKYYQGGSSPIDACKKANGYSNAWLHHKGRNKHHYEYWTDNMDNGGEPLQMPYKYAAELICDYMGAGRAYYGKEFTMEKEYEWWQIKKNKPLFMHAQTKIFIDLVFESLLENEGNLSSSNLLKLYKEATEKYKL